MDSEQLHTGRKPDASAGGPKQSKRTIAQMASLYENDPNPVCVSSPDGKIIFANQAAWQLFPDLEALGINHPFLDNWPEIARQMSQDKTAHMERKIEVNDRYYLQFIKHIEASNTFNIYACDISELETTVQSSRSETQKYRYMLEHSKDIIYVMNSNMELLYLSPVVKQLLGYEPQELQDHTLETIIHPDDLPQVRMELRRIFESGAQGLRKIEFRMKHTSGEWRWYMSDGNLIPNPVEKSMDFYGIATDITRLKQTEETLKKSEANLLAAIAAMPDPVFITDKSGDILFFNKAFADYHGYKNIADCPDSLAGFQDIVEFYTPEGMLIPFKQWNLSRALRGESGKDIEYLSKNKATGKVCTGSYNFAPILNAGGDITGAVVTIRDITELKKAETEILRLNQLYAIVSQIDQAIVRSANQEQFLEGICQILTGYEHFKLVWIGQINTDNARIIPVASSGDNRDILNRLEIYTDERPGGRGPSGECARTLRPAIKDLENDISVQIWRDIFAQHQLYDSAAFPIIVAGKIWGVLTVYSDIKNYFRQEEIKLLKEASIDIGFALNHLNEEKRRLQAEDALRQSEEQYRLITRNMSDAVLLLNMQNQILYCNLSAERLSGFTLEELNTLPPEKYLTPASLDLMRKTLAEQLTPERLADPNCRILFSMELEMHHKNGSNIWADIRYSIIRGIDGAPVARMLICRDTTERHQIEAERQHMHQQAELTSRLAAIGEMAAGIAHEINNPLTSVLGFSELLLKRDLPENVKEELQIVADGSQRIANIVKRLLTFARQNKPMRTPTSINELIESTIKLRSYVLQTANIDVATSLDETLPDICADPGQLQQVFLNLIVNAEQSMETTHRKGELKIITQKHGDHIRIIFRDNGCGISRENLNRVFEPFFTTKEPGEGTGLGLSLSHSIILEHHGEMWVESEPGQGATFYIELPIRKNSAETGCQPDTPKTTVSAKILAIDDEVSILKYLQATLTASGHKVDCLNNPEKALASDIENYDLILLDIRMPGISGIQLYAQMLQQHPSVQGRVIFITGDTSNTEVRDFLTQTKLPCLFKPLDAGELNQTIAAMLEPVK
jgi:PAS domain S-box-containing protein